MSHNCICGRPLAGDAICPGCSRSLQIALGNISSYWRDLDTVRARQTRYGDAGGRTGAEKALPVDLRFLDWAGDGSRLVEQVRSTVVTWTRVVLEERPILEGPTHPACLHVSCARLNRSRPPADNIPACCAYLLGHADWVRSQHWAPEILDELLDVERGLRRIIDRPADKWFAGPCDTCERDMYARVGAASVECGDCDLVYDVADRRAWLLDQAQDRLLTAAELSRAVSWLGTEPLTSARVWKWAQRKRIVAHGTAIHRGNEIPTYLVSDAIGLMAQDARPKAG